MINLRFLFLILLIFTGCLQDEIDKKIINVNTNSEPEINTEFEEITTHDISISNDNVVEKLMAFGKDNPETIVKIFTSKGTIKIRLYQDTPLHRANFIMLAKMGYFNNSVFTRVVKEFIAQAGGAYSDEQKMIKRELGKYTIPAEIKQDHFHKKGAIGAARLYEDNLDKRSAPYYFYFVEGTKFSKKALKYYEEENGYTYSKDQMEYYLNHAGAAHIDGEHTVFGEITEGLNVVQKLTSVKTDQSDWPITDLFIDSVVVLKN